MESGQLIGKKNFQTFNTWLASKTDDDFRSMVRRGVLSRTEIAKECNFAKSALKQNPAIRESLHALEEDLRRRNILPPVVLRIVEDEVPLPMREPSKIKAAQVDDRLRRLEQENASLRAENDELKYRLRKYEVLHEALSLTGRIPR